MWRVAHVSGVGEEDIAAACRMISDSEILGEDEKYDDEDKIQVILDQFHARHLHHVWRRLPDPALGNRGEKEVMERRLRRCNCRNQMGETVERES